MLSVRAKETIEKVRQFVEKEVIPNENVFEQQLNEGKYYC